MQLFITNFARKYTSEQKKVTIYVGDNYEKFKED